jgi:hypothetical protein
MLGHCFPFFSVCRTPEAVAEEMLRRMIALQRFDRLRAEVRQAGGNSSAQSEDDILNEIS